VFLDLQGAAQAVLEVTAAAVAVTASREQMPRTSGPVHRHAFLWPYEATVAPLGALQEQPVSRSSLCVLPLRVVALPSVQETV
jgi:hypothetical protein